MLSPYFITFLRVVFLQYAVKTLGRQGDRHFVQKTRFFAEVRAGFEASLGLWSAEHAGGADARPACGL